VDASAWFQEAKAWAQDRLPELNRSAYAGLLTPGEVAAAVNDLLRSAPPPGRLDDRRALQALMILGVCGSSVERHAQQTQQRADEPVTPGRGLALLRAAAGRPFAAYYAEVADRIGHMHRDSFVTFVERNGPELRVVHPETREPLHAVPAAFEDGAYITFTGRTEELEFIRLLKESAALQGAANLFLVRLQDPAIPLSGGAAVNACFNAEALMLAVRAKLVEFMRRSSFHADFFLDVLRQYACAWSDRPPVLRPPSGANDDTSLHRDVMLFDELLPPAGEFPGYTAYVRRVFPALMPASIQRLAAAMSAGSIEARILKRLGTTRDALDRLDPRESQALVDANPWLAACTAVYDAQRDLSRAHYGTVTRYLVEPKRQRDARRDPRELVTVVPNTHGTTGMDPLRVVRDLDEARAHHPLAALASRTRERMAVILRRLGHRVWNHRELLSLCAAVPPDRAGRREVRAGA